MKNKEFLESMIHHKIGDKIITFLFSTEGLSEEEQEMFRKAGMKRLAKASGFKMEEEKHQDNQKINFDNLSYFLMSKIKIFEQIIKDEDEDGNVENPIAVYLQLLFLTDTKFSELMADIIMCRKIIDLIKIKRKELQEIINDLAA